MTGNHDPEYDYVIARQREAAQDQRDIDGLHGLWCRMKRTRAALILMLQIAAMVAVAVTVAHALEWLINRFGPLAILAIGVPAIGGGLLIVAIILDIKAPRA